MIYLIIGVSFITFILGMILTFIVANGKLQTNSDDCERLRSTALKYAKQVSNQRQTIIRQDELIQSLRDKFKEAV